MPKIDVAAVPARKGSGYPPPFDAPCGARARKRLGDAGGLRDAMVFSLRSNIASEALYRSVGFREGALHRRYTKPID